MRRFVLWAGILTGSAVPFAAQDLPVSNYEGDPRLARLMDFLEVYGGPVRNLAPQFLEAADRHDLDWRLLPSICVVETSGGKAAFKNNIFGWDSARRGFSSVREGIYHVASRLAESRLYKGKELNRLLATYNPRAGYPARVKAFMRLADPTEPLRARRPLLARVTASSELRRTALLAPAQ